jgi:hypothetical protein
MIVSGTGVNSVTHEPTSATRDLDRLREVTGKVVGSVFFGTLLKTMRESELKGAYGHGGRGEEIFSAQLHGILAERMGARLQPGLGNAVYDRLQRQQRGISTRQTVVQRNT